jgi:hypothetical protein
MRKEQWLSGIVRTYVKILLQAVNSTTDIKHRHFRELYTPILKEFLIKIIMVKLFLHLIKHYTVKAYGGVEVSSRNDQLRK